MKKALLAVVLLIGAVTSLFAQMKEGKIVYERKINVYRMITDPEMRARVPEFRTSQMELLFNEQASLFRTVPDEEAPDPFANNGGDRGGQRFMFRMPETTTYTDLKEQIQYESRPMFEKTFLIVDSLKPLKWKISEETKTIAKHVCKKATTSIVGQSVRIGGGPRMGRANNTDSTKTPSAAIAPKETEVAVWYTEDIAASVGKPGAVRAAGSANGANNVAVLIPCHRVIRSDGSLGGYAYGLERKARLLEREGNESVAQQTLL